MNWNPWRKESPAPPAVPVLSGDEKLAGLVRVLKARREGFCDPLHLKPVMTAATRAALQIRGDELDYVLDLIGEL
jgi:hypothetical protein